MKKMLNEDVVIIGI